MEIPELIDVIYLKVLNKYREQIEKDDRCFVMTAIDEEKELLNAKLNDEQKQLLKNYTLALINKYDYINYKLNTFILYLGIKYGMDLQAAFSEE